MLALPAPDRTLDGLREYWLAASRRSSQTAEFLDATPPGHPARATAWEMFLDAGRQSDAAWEEYQTAMTAELARLSACIQNLGDKYDQPCPF